MARQWCSRVAVALTFVVVLALIAVPAFAAGGRDTLVSLILKPNAAEFSQPIEVGSSVSADGFNISNVSVSSAGSVVVQAFGGATSTGTFSTPVNSPVVLKSGDRVRISTNAYEMGFPYVKFRVMNTQPFSIQVSLVVSSL